MTVKIIPLRISFMLVNWAHRNPGLPLAARHARIGEWKLYVANVIARVLATNWPVWRIINLTKNRIEQTMQTIDRKFNIRYRKSFALGSTSWTVGINRVRSGISDATLWSLRCCYPRNSEPWMQNNVCYWHFFQCEPCEALTSDGSAVANDGPHAQACQSRAL